MCNNALVLFFQVRLVLNEEPLLFCGRTGPWWAGDRKPGWLTTAQGRELSAKAIGLDPRLQKKASLSEGTHSI